MRVQSALVLQRIRWVIQPWAGYPERESTNLSSLAQEEPQLSHLPANLASHGWIKWGESHPSSQQSRYGSYHTAVKSRKATNKSRDKLLRNAHQLSAAWHCPTLLYHRLSKDSSAGEAAVKASLSWGCWLCRLCWCSGPTAPDITHWSLHGHCHHTDVPASQEKVAMKGFTRQIQRSCSQFPANPIQNPSYFEKLLRRQGGRAQEPCRKQISTQSASCFPPFIDMFYWAVEWWDCYFLQLGFQQQLCKHNLIKQRISKQQIAKIIRFGQHLPNNTCNFWRWDCSKEQNKFQFFSRKNRGLSY